ncbi:MAG: histidine phosphatase family protein [Shimia sp.]
MFKTFPTDTIYLLRHAVPEDGRDPDLSEAGRNAAAALPDQLGGLGIDGCFTSPAARTRQTIAPVAEAQGLQVMAMPDLREHRLAMSGYDPADPMRADRFTQRRAARPGAESFDAAAARLRQAVRSLAARPLRAPLCATHGGTIAALLSQLDRGYGFAEFDAMPMPALFQVTHRNGAVVKLRPLDLTSGPVEKLS